MNHENAQSKMAALIRNRIAVLTRPSAMSMNCIRHWSTFPTLHAGQKMRLSRGQARDGIAYGPLTDLPDWSFADGTPAPETKRRRTRRLKRMDVAHQILTYLNEVERAGEARDEDGNVLDSTKLPKKEQEIS